MDWKSIKTDLLSMNRLIFCEFSLSKATDWKKPDGIVFERFNPMDMEMLDETLQQMEFESDFTLDDVILRIRKRYFCYVVKREDRIIGYCWWAVGDHHIEYFDGNIELRSDELFCINNYMHRAFRGLGLLNMLKTYAFSELKNCGYNRDIICYYQWNKAATRMNRKMGYSYIGSVTHGYLFTIRYLVNTVTTVRLSFHRDPLLLWKKLLSRRRGHQRSPTDYRCPF
ncbi:GNAT family N-acetyltransferase [bacterium]|nr:GNAT family N-acetyltransferase [candidate division CSSED10-310 bacterium]